MAAAAMDPNRAAVAFGRRAVPQLFEQLQQRDAPGRLRALTSLCDLVHEPERLYQTVTGGEWAEPDTHSGAKESRTIHTPHFYGRVCSCRLALLSSSLLPPLFGLLDDSSSSCRRNVHLVLNGLAQLPLMLKLRQMPEEEEEQVLLLSTLSCCSRLDPLPALASDGVPVLGQTLTRCSPDVRREAAAVLMALSVPEDGKRQVCEEQFVLVLMVLLQDGDVEVQTNAAGVIMNIVIITTGPSARALALLFSEHCKNRTRNKALTSLAEAPEGRSLLRNQLPLLERRSQEQDQDVRRAAQTAIRVVTWSP
uniref:Radial spoke head 14 homolog n=1 Tax=Fundulus heteroclitus TaxID=8078 RepID=A0A3Q2P1U1_FUNHE